MLAFDFIVIACVYVSILEGGNKYSQGIEERKGKCEGWMRVTVMRREKREVEKEIRRMRFRRSEGQMEGR